MTTGKEKHRLMAYWHRLRADREMQLASHEWQKHVLPDLEIPYPDEHPALHLFAVGDYLGFCDSLGIAHPVTGDLCAESESPSGN